MLELADIERQARARIHPKGHYAFISAGCVHTCGIRQTGSIDCWVITNHIERIPKTSKIDE